MMYIHILVVVSVVFCWYDTSNLYHTMHDTWYILYSSLCTYVHPHTMRTVDLFNSMACWEVHHGGALLEDPRAEAWGMHIVDAWKERPPQDEKTATRSCRLLFLDLEEENQNLAKLFFYDDSSEIRQNCPTFPWQMVLYFSPQRLWFKLCRFCESFCESKPRRREKIQIVWIQPPPSNTAMMVSRETHYWWWLLLCGGGISML